jgi:hypothetical protein
MQGCSNPNIPEELSHSAAEKAQFRGRVLHSTQFRSQLDDILKIVKPVSPDKGDDAGSIVIVGGGKSAQE